MATGPLSARLRQMRYVIGLLRYDEPQTLTPAQRTQARANIGAADASTAALAARQVRAGMALTGGGPLTGDVTIAADIASQAEAQTGGNNEKLMTPLRTAQALAASSIGYGQTWVAAGSGISRAANTTYQNTTNRPIMVSVSVGTNESATVQVGATAGGLVTIYSNNDWDRVPFNFIVPPGHHYRLNTGGTVWYWSELR